MYARARARRSRSRAPHAPHTPRGPYTTAKSARPCRLAAVRSSPPPRTTAQATRRQRMSVRSWHWRAGARRARVPARAHGTHIFLRLAQRTWRRLLADGELVLSARAPVLKEFCVRGRRRPSGGGEEGATGWRGAGGLAGGAQRTASVRARSPSAHSGSQGAAASEERERERLIDRGTV